MKQILRRLPRSSKNSSRRSINSKPSLKKPTITKPRPTLNGQSQSTNSKLLFTNKSSLTTSRLNQPEFSTACQVALTPAWTNNGLNLEISQAASSGAIADKVFSLLMLRKLSTTTLNSLTTANTTRKPGHSSSFSNTNSE